MQSAPMQIVKNTEARVLKPPGGVIKKMTKRVHAACAKPNVLGQKSNIRSAHCLPMTDINKMNKQNELLRKLETLEFDTDYERSDASHVHCWKSKTPPCGQRIEHLKCCLCERLNPKAAMRSPYEPSKRERETLRANLKGAQEGFDSVFSAEAPATDVSWEKQFESEFVEEISKSIPLRAFIRKQIDLAYDAGGKTVGGTGRVMYQRGYDEGYVAGIGSQSEQKQWMFEAGKGIGRKKAIAEVWEMVKNRLHVAKPTHTSEEQAYDIKNEWMKETREALLEALSNK